MQALQKAFLFIPIITNLQQINNIGNYIVIWLLCSLRYNTICLLRVSTSIEHEVIGYIDANHFNNNNNDFICHFCPLLHVQASFYVRYSLWSSALGVRLKRTKLLLEASRRLGDDLAKSIILERDINLDYTVWKSVFRRVWNKQIARK